MGARQAIVEPTRRRFLDLHPPSASLTGGRKRQRREQRRLVAGVQRRHEAVEHGERRRGRFPVGLGLGLVEDHLSI